MRRFNGARLFLACVNLSLKLVLLHGQQFHHVLSRKLPNSDGAKRISLFAK